HIAEARYAIKREARIQHAAVGEVDIFEQRSAHTLHNCAFNLILQSVWIHHRTAVPGFDYTHDAHCAAGGIDGDFGASGHVSALFESPSQSEAAFRRRLLLSPAEAFGRSFKNRAQSRI